MRGGRLPVRETAVFREQEKNMAGEKSGAQAQNLLWRRGPKDPWWESLG